MDFSPDNRKRVFEAYARYAFGCARQANDRRDRRVWEKIAHFWLDLAAYKSRGLVRFGARYSLPLANLEEHLLPPGGGSPPPTQFRTAICCPRCGEEGEEIWEMELESAHGDLDTQLVGRSGRFYERISKRPPYPIEVVCQQCGAVVKD